ELGVDGVGDDAGRDLVVLCGREDAGLRELARERRLRLCLRRLHELIDAAAGEVAEVDLAIGVFAPGDDAIRGAGDFAMVKGVGPFLRSGRKSCVPSMTDQP